MKPNFTNGIIYKLCCKDPNVSDFYIGSTTNKRARKSKHKSDCYNTNKNYYNSRVYQCIRENGGFDNWSFIIIEEYKCENRSQLYMDLEPEIFVFLLPG